MSQDVNPFHLSIIIPAKNEQAAIGEGAKDAESMQATGAKREAAGLPAQAGKGVEEAS